MKNGQFVKIPADILADQGLTSTTKLTYAIIADAMRGKGVSWPGVRTIALKIGSSDGAVQRALSQIEKTNLLRVEHGGRGKRNRYFLPDQQRVHSGDRSVPETGTVSKTRSVSKTGTGVSKTATEVYPKRIPKQTRRKKQTTTCRASARTNSKSPKNESDHQALIIYFTEQWSEIVGGGCEYQFGGAKDGSSAKRILGAVGSDLDRAKRMVDAYLADDDPWIEENAKDRPLVLLASGKRLTKYLAATAAHRPQGLADEDSASAEHPLIADARAKWPDDVAENLEEWMALAQAAEVGRILGNSVRVSDAKSGGEFRAEHNQELARVAN